MCLAEQQLRETEGCRDSRVINNTSLRPQPLCKQEMKFHPEGDQSSQFAPTILALAPNPFSPGQRVLVGHRKTMILRWSRGGFLAPHAIWQCLRTCFIVRTGKGYYWY